MAKNEPTVIAEVPADEAKRWKGPPPCCRCGVRSDLGFGETKDEVKPYCLPCFEQNFPEQVEEQQEAFRLAREYFDAKERH